VREAIEALPLANVPGAVTCEEGTILDIRREGLGTTVLDPDPGPDGDDVWQHTMTFSYTIRE
jgi:hypothetical protein